jgi:site-specific DNA-methyltransferase (adenine-specific)
LGADSRVLAFAMGRQVTAAATATEDVYECAEGCPRRMLDEQGGERRSGGIAAGTPRGENTVFGKAPKAVATSVDIPASTGGASRFFYCPKPTKKETELGLDHLPPRTAGEATDREDGTDGLNSPRAGAGRTGGARNYHPTKKSVALMRYLIRLVTPVGGVVLDPFAGSGTTGVAALAEGCSFVGCELTDEYIPIVEGRLRHALASTTARERLN